MSAAVERVFGTAKNLPKELNQGEVQESYGTRGHLPGMYQAVVPLDMLAAALREPCEGTKMLQEAGID